MARIRERGVTRTSGWGLARASGWDLCRAGQRADLVEKPPRVVDHALAANWVVASTAPGAAIFGNHIAAVERVVQRTPAGVGGIGGEAGVLNRHHELRARDGGDFRINPDRGDLEIAGFRLKVAYFAQKGAIGRPVVIRARIAVVPAIDLLLQFIAPGQQFFVAGGESVDQAFKSRPERIPAQPNLRQQLVVDESRQLRGDPQTTRFEIVDHRAGFLFGGWG